MKAAIIACGAGKTAKTPAAELAAKIRGHKVVWASWGNLSVRKAGRRALRIIARDESHASIMTRLKEALALLPETEWPEVRR